MSGDYSVSYESGLTLYSLVFDPATGTAWNGSALVDRVTNWSACAEIITDTGSGLYEGLMPETLPSGTYLVQSYLQVGPSPAETDPIVGTGTLIWPGSPDPLPGSEFSTAYESGHTLNAVLLNAEGLAWNGTGFADPTPETWGNFLIAMDDDGSGTYTGNVPAAVPPGTYDVHVYLQVGPSPVDTDPIVGMGPVSWPGGGELPPAGGFRAALVARLNSNITLANLVGDRIYPQFRPQRSALPAVVFRVPSIDRDHDLDGPTGMADALVELTAYSSDFVDCDRVSRQLRNIFDGFTGILGFNVEVTETVSDDEGDEYDGPSDGSDDGTHEITISYQITFRESTPNRSQV